MKKYLMTAGALAAAILTGCASAPTGPTVAALPGANKPLEVFQQEDLECRNYAWNAMGGNAAVEAQNNKAVGAAVLGTAIGVAAGALMGAGPHRDHGAAVGAGAATGLIAGSAIGADSSAGGGERLQLIYDNAYAACMSSKGNTVQLPNGQTYRTGGSGAGAAVAAGAVAVGVGVGLSGAYDRPPRHHHGGPGWGGPGPRGPHGGPYRP